MIEILRSRLSFFSDSPFPELEPYYNDSLHGDSQYYQIRVSPVISSICGQERLADGAVHASFIVTANNLRRFYLRVLRKCVILSVREIDWDSFGGVPTSKCMWFGEPFAMRSAGLAPVDLFLDPVGRCLLKMSSGSLRRVLYSQIRTPIDCYCDFNMSKEALVDVDVYLGNVQMPVEDYFTMGPGSIIEIPCDGKFPIRLLLNEEIIRGVATVKEDRLILEVTEETASSEEDKQDN